jgi:hypothetical protein
MTPKFLNDKLITSNRFAPGKKEEGQDGSRENAHARQKEELDRILRKEDRKTRETVVKRDLSETKRRKKEVANMLEEAIANVRHEAELLGKQSELFAQLRKELSQLSDEEMAPEELRQIKQKIQTAHIELTKFVRNNNDAPVSPPGSGTSQHTHLPSLSFAQLTRIGLGLTWPLIAVVILAVVVVVASLVSLFAT